MTNILLDINKLILINKLKEIKKKNGVIYVADFNSGYLTDFIIEIKKKFKLNLYLDSFTNIFSNQNKLDPQHNIFKRQLLTCSDESYKNMFRLKKYNSNFMVKSQQNPNKRMINVFFDIKPKDLRTYYDLIIITGPNGNGRDIAFLHIQNKIKPNGFILLNELDKYISIETMNSFFNTQIEFTNNVTIDRIALYKIID